MALSTSYSFLRRNLSQRLNYWGGDLANNGPGTLMAGATSNTAVDITRPEPDDEWNEAWIVINPGSTDQVNTPTVWRRVAADAGWVQATGTITIQGSWPAPYTNGPAVGTSYELFKVFRPENWLQAINWALANSYPKRHVPVNFEVPQDTFGRIVKWGELVSNLALANPTVAPTVTEVANGNGLYQPGVYTFGYTFSNDLGETLVSPTVNVTFTGVNSQVKFAQLNSVPAAVLGVVYYSSIDPNDSQMASLSIGQSALSPNALPFQQRGTMIRGVVPEVTFPNPNPDTGFFPPIYNTTNVDVQELHHVLQRINPGNYPEVWNDLGSELYKPLGGKSIMLMFRPSEAYNLRFICSAVVPLMARETDVTDEPPEMIYAGGESYLWNLLVKTSTIVGTNWADLAKSSQLQYEKLKSDYGLDLPRNIAYRPIIRTGY